MKPPNDETILSPNFDSGDGWDAQLETALEALAPDVPLQNTKELTRYLANVSPVFRSQVFVELVKLEMTARCEHGEVPWIENYLGERDGDLTLAEVPLSLVMEEQQLRRDLACPIDPHEYLARFPHLESVLSELSSSQRSARTGSSSQKRLAEAMTNLDTGNTIDDFEIISPLGRGAFAQVYLARQVSMARLVALKVSRETGGESQTLARLDHANIVRVFDQRQLPFGGPHLLYMQYLPGGTLASVIDLVRQTDEEERSGQLVLQAIDQHLLKASQQAPEHSSVRAWLTEASWPMTVAWIGLQLGQALQAAHEKGVLHRDVKPANVLLSAEGVPRLADFNVSFASKTSGDEGNDSIGGSIAYMSPEHLNAVANIGSSQVNEVQEPADVYSTAILLWEMWQGSRPFANTAGAATQKELIERQLKVRSQPIELTSDGGDGSQRVLEKVLREALDPDVSRRIRSGAELSGKLQLALYPEAATLFDPVEGSLNHRLRHISPWLVATLLILLPNVAAGAFNFLYNYIEIIQRHPEMKSGFLSLANTVNAVAFPIGGVLMFVVAGPVVDAMRCIRRGEAIQPGHVSRTINMSRHAAWIGGALWGIAALIYPIVLSIWFPTFTGTEAVHFFGSLIICGGVAAVYPFFGLILLTTWVYYPALVSRDVQDDQFDWQADRVRTWCGRYLLAAAGIPLLGLALLLSRETMARYVVASSVAATGLGLLAAWTAYQVVLENWQKMADVLSSRRRTLIPGANQ